MNVGGVRIGVGKQRFFSSSDKHFTLKTMILPRQARDKHMEYFKKSGCLPVL